ncbi:hypothetical protein L1887_18456 [Cichorium endivia]|nr:hypothetical protein L1887_18456 [Cichorium endivia]
MSQYEQNQPPQVHNYVVEGGTGKDYVAPPLLPPPPAVGPPMKDGYDSGGQDSIARGTQSRGDGFWRGCCAGMCCCCLLDMCF